MVASLSTVKKIGIEQLEPGMFIHDLDCGWMDHPFLRSRFEVKHLDVIEKLRRHGIREVYIDTRLGRDTAPTTGVETAGQDSGTGPALAEKGAKPFKTAILREEMLRASILRREAEKVVHEVINGARTGKQIDLDRVEPLVMGMVDSIFRNQDALLTLSRLNEHDGYTFQHSVSVCTLMIVFARGLGMPRETIQEIATGALLHDVGKSAIPDEILLKPGKLTEAEFARMQSHVVQGIILLRQTPGISDIAIDIVGQHHERYDGTGYPNRLKGDAISVPGQMGSIVDVYDAITTDRPYHKAMPATKALGKMLEWSRNQFNPELVRAYIKAIGIYPTGSLVKLASGRLAIVIEQHREKSLLPVVRAIYNSKWRHYVEPEEVDLSQPLCRDQIISHESFDHWGIDPQRWYYG